MYVFCDKEIKHPLYIHFLCGNKYKKNCIFDKRNVLKTYIDNKENNYALILERLFKLENYSEMGFGDLEEVELMASNYARSIIIIHETVSTAAEISLFGSKKNLKNKILVLYASPEVVQTDSLGTFLKEAFLKDGKVKSNSCDFDRKLYKVKYKDIAFFNIYFKNNKIDDETSLILEKFWLNSSTKYDISFKKYNALRTETNFYRIVKESKLIEIRLDYVLIMAFVISILINNQLMKGIREAEEIVTNICKIVREILTNTISYREKLDLNSYIISIKTYDKFDINLPIRFCIYILLNSGLINIKDERIEITNDFKKSNLEYKYLLLKIEEKNFFDFCGDNYE